MSRAPLRRDRVAASAVAATLALVLGACSGDVIGDFPSPPSPAITDSPTPEVEEGILAEIAVDGSPCDVAEAAGRVWVTAFDGDELIEIDPATNDVVDIHRMPGGPCGMTADDGILWIETQNAGSLVLFDPERREVSGRLRVRGGVVGTISTPWGLWAAAGQAEQILRIDPEARRIVARINVEGPLGGLAFEEDQIWTVAGRSELVRIDPRSNRIVERIPLESYEPEGLAIDRTTLWVSSSFEGEVLRVDRRTGRVRDRLPVADSLFGGIVVGADYWVAGSDGTVYHLDGRTGEVVDRFELVGFGPVPAAGNLWTVDFVASTVFRLDEPAG